MLVLLPLGFPFTGFIDRILKKSRMPLYWVSFIFNTTNYYRGWKKARGVHFPGRGDAATRRINLHSVSPCLPVSVSNGFFQVSPGNNSN
jgi:hypothetical protein